MKQFRMLLFAAAVSVFLLHCGKDEPQRGKGEFVIVTSFYPVYIIAKNVAYNMKNVRVVNMTPPVTGCLHDYSITSADMKKLENADIFLYNGAGMESFIDKIGSRYPDLKKGTLADGIRLITHDGEENPHVWVSVGNAVRMVENCAGVLSSADPENSAAYRKNAARYIDELNSLRSEMAKSLGRFRGREIITFHEAFPYFAAENGFRIAAVVEREPGSEPSAGELAETVNIVRRSKIKVLFAEPQYPSLSADIIARETGARVYTLDPAVTGDDERDAYIRIMKNNITTLVKAFNEQ